MPHPPRSSATETRRSIVEDVASPHLRTYSKLGTRLELSQHKKSDIPEARLLSGTSEPPVVNQDRRKKTPIIHRISAEQIPLAPSPIPWPTTGIAENRKALEYGMAEGSWPQDVIQGRKANKRERLTQVHSDDSVDTRHTRDRSPDLTRARADPKTLWLDGVRASQYRSLVDLEHYQGTQGTQHTSETTGPESLKDYKRERGRLQNQIASLKFGSLEDGSSGSATRDQGVTKGTSNSSSVDLNRRSRFASTN